MNDLYTILLPEMNLKDFEKAKELIEELKIYEILDNYITEEVEYKVQENDKILQDEVDDLQSKLNRISNIVDE